MESGHARCGVINTGETTFSSYQRSYPEACNPFLPPLSDSIRTGYSHLLGCSPREDEVRTSHNSGLRPSGRSLVTTRSSRASRTSRGPCLASSTKSMSSPAAGTLCRDDAAAVLSARSLRRDHSIFGDEVCMYLQVQALSDGFASLLLFRWNTHLSRYLRCGGSALAEDLEAVR